MWNLQDDNELDKLSRDAAENYPLDRSPDSWNKLQLRLDAEMPEERRRRYLLFFLLFLFLGSGVFWLSRINSVDTTEEIGERPNSNTEQSASSKQAADQMQAPKSASPVAEANNKPIAVEKNELPDTKGPAVSSGSFASPNTLQYKSRENVNTSPHNMRMANANRNKKQSNKKDLVSKGKSATQEAAVVEEKNPDLAEKNMIAKDQEPIPVDEKVTEGKNEQPESVKTDEEKKIAPEAAATEPHEKSISNKVNSRWTFGAVYGPDLSTVNFTHTQPLGYNVGLQIEFRLSNKFSLQSGLIYTKKNYKMNGEDYHPPKGYWTDYVKLEDVTGSCYMIDIPLNVRFNAVQKKSSNIFFGAGLSTYLMKKEEYSYYYWYSGMPVTRHKEYQSNEDYVLGILNLSAGFEKKISSAFSLQVEPFFKQSLNGVGFGSISLNSTGVYFSVRYSPISAHKSMAASKK